MTDETRTCDVCRASLAGKRRDARTCSAACRQELRRRTRSATPTATTPPVVTPETPAEGLIEPPEWDWHP